MSRSYKSNTNVHSNQSNSNTSVLGNVIKFAKQVRNGLSQTGPQIQERPNIVGGAPDRSFQNVFEKLGPSNNAPDRITAAKEISKSITDYSVSSIQEIWESARDMLSLTNSPECRRAGLELMIACIRQTPDDTDVRLINSSFYNDIVNSCNVQDFDLQLQAMMFLTHNGTVVEDFFKSKESLPKVLDSWFRILSEETQKIREKVNTDSTILWGSSTEKNFLDFVKFTILIYQHNSLLFSTGNTIDLLDRVNKTCQATSSEQDILVCLDLVLTIQQNSYIPLKSLPDLSETLCGIIACATTINQSREKAWCIIKAIYNGPLAINMFNNFLQFVGNRSVKTTMNTRQGATIALRCIVEMSSEKNREFEFPLYEVLAAYRSSIDSESMRQNLEVITCLFSLISNDFIRDKVFTFAIWTSPKISPFEIFYSIARSRSMQRSTAQLSNYFDRQSFTDRESILTRSESKMSKQYQVLERLQEIFNYLADIFEQDKFKGPREIIINFFADMVDLINSRCAILVINHFRKFSCCHPFTEHWRNNLRILLNGFYFDRSWNSEIRLLALDLLCDIYKIAREICETEIQQMLIENIFKISDSEKDITLFSYLVDKFVDLAEETSPESIEIASKFLFCVFSIPAEDSSQTRRRSITSLTSSYANDRISMTSANSVPNNASPQFSPIHDNRGDASTFQSQELLESYRPIVAVGFCKAFLAVFQYSSIKARRFYYNLIVICQKSLSSNDAASFLEVARLLCRIRSTTEGYIYLSTPTNMDGLSASVGRNTILNPKIDKSTIMWWYPETPSYILDNHLNKPSSTLKRHSDETFEIQRLKANEYEIDIALWFNEIIGIIENGAHWEIYSFVWAHFGPQLSNLELFRTSGSDIHRLRKILCDQLLNTKLPNVKYPKDVTKFEILISLVRTISSLIGYHDMFTKQDGEEIVKCLVSGLSSWEQTAVSCIHALVVCCHELPLPIKKYLGQIFTKFQSKISNTNTSPHILEFLLSLSRLPTLVDNFTQDEYKRVFGMAFQYIRDAYTLSQQAESVNNTDPRSLSPVSSPIGGPVSTPTISNNKQLSVYLLSLAYNVVATWFLTLRITNRKYLAKFIIRNLILAAGTKNDIDPQGMAYIDLISRFSYSDLDLTIQTTISLPSLEGSSNRQAKQWIYGNSIVSIDTDEQTGESYIVIRRPTGTTMLTLKPDEKIIPSWLEEAVLKRNDKSLNIDRIADDIPIAFTPNYFFLQVMYSTDLNTSVKPLQLPNDVTTSRAISSFDRTPVVDFHKIGILYIGPNQQDEKEILSNPVGSPSYRRFLENLGKLVRLKDNKKVYSGGLDTTNDIDGKYAYVWSDKVTQMIFHITTLMPAPANPSDTSYSSKKRHIGNDFVNIYFDESELPFKFDIIKSQFNFINIVITPVSVNFSKHKVFTRSDETPVSPILQPSRPRPGEEHAVKPKVYYKVRAYCKPGVPAIFAACHLKIVSEDSLAGFVRNLALISSKFATVWNNAGEYRSNWQYRLEQINTLRDKVVNDINKSTHNQPAQANNKGHQRGESVDNKDIEVGQSFLDQLTAGGSGLGGLGSINEGGESMDKRDSSGQFTMEIQDGDDFPLLKSLDFTSFTS